MVKKLASCIGEYRKYAIATPIIMLGEAIMEILIPLIMANMIDYGIQNKDIGYTVRMGVLIFSAPCFLSPVARAVVSARHMPRWVLQKTCVQNCSARCKPFHLQTLTNFPPLHW